MNAKRVVEKARPRVGAVCRSMIIMGRTDGQIMAVLRRMFGFDQSKVRNIAWYRWDLRRRGLTENRRARKKPVEHERRHSGYRYAAR